MGGFIERQKKIRENAYSDFKKSLKDARFDEPVTMWIFRPIAFIFVKLLYKTKITPNAVSFTGIGLGIISGIFLSVATPKSITIAALIYFFAIVADNADGMLARLTGKGTPMGRIIDGISDYAVGTAVYVGLLIAFNKGALQTGFSKLSPLMVLVITAASMISHLVAVDYYRSQFTAFGLGKREVIEAEEKIFLNKTAVLKSRESHLPEKVIIVLFSIYHSIQTGLARKKDYDNKSYFEANKKLIFLWFWIGPAANALVLMVSLILFRPVIYLTYTVVLGNVYILILLVIQNIVNSRIPIEQKSKHTV